MMWCRRLVALGLALTTCLGTSVASRAESWPTRPVRIVVAFGAGGTADVLTPPFEARRMARLIPGARLELMPGGGHMLMLERTDEVDRLIVDFARPDPPDRSVVLRWPRR